MMQCVFRAIDSKQHRVLWLCVLTTTVLERQLLFINTEQFTSNGGTFNNGGPLITEYRHLLEIVTSTMEIFTSTMEILNSNGGIDL